MIESLKKTSTIELHLMLLFKYENIVIDVHIHINELDFN